MADSDTESTQESMEAEQKPQEETTGEQSHVPLAGIVISLGMVLFLALILLRRNYLVKRRQGRLVRLGVADNIRHLYSSFYELLCWDGWDAGLGCSDDSFPRVVSERYKALSEEEVRRIAALVLSTCYGQQAPGEEELAFLRECYMGLRREIYEKLPCKGRILFLIWKCY